MIENINDFISFALLACFLIMIVFALMNQFNKRRVRKHIEEEYYYYRDFEEFDDN